MTYMDMIAITGVVELCGIALTTQKDGPNTLTFITPIAVVLWPIYWISIAYLLICEFNE